MLIDELNKAAQKNRKCFSAAGWCIYQATFIIDDMLPCFFLETKCLHMIGCKPIMNDNISFCAFEFQT